MSGADNEPGNQASSNETRFVWGLRAIGQIAGGLNRDQVHWLIKTGKLKTKITTIQRRNIMGL